MLILSMIFWTSLVHSQVHAEPLCKDCNVVVIAMDALQAKHVTHLGHKVATTPNLDRLAQGGFSFRQAISPSSWTVPTYLSVFSSMYPSVHGMTNRYVTFTKDSKEQADFKKRKPEILTMAQTFKAAGYKTGGFTGDAGVSAVLGYDKGFEIYTDETQFGGLENSGKKAVEWLDKVGKQKFFMFLHGYDSHGQFDLPKDYNSRFEKAKSKGKYSGTKEEQAGIREAGLQGKPVKLSKAEVDFWRTWYDGKIADADERVGNFLRELEKRQLKEKTIVIVFSDHGTEFYEHGRFDHGHSLYDELVHVPWIISIPGQKGGKLIPQQVTTMDMLPTLLDISGVKAIEGLEKQMQGKSVRPLFDDAKLPGRDVFIETDYRNYTHKRGLRTADGWKYIQTLENGKEELFNLRSDPGEQKNLAASNKSKLAQLKDTLNKHVAALPAPTGGIATGCLPAYKGQCEYENYQDYQKYQKYQEYQKYDGKQPYDGKKKDGK